MSLTVAVESASLHVQNLSTRFPFQYGIASLTHLPHVFLQVEAVVKGVAARGWSAEHLPPKWFTKDPATRFEEDLPEMLRVLRHAVRAAERLGNREGPFFDLWMALYAEQSDWAEREGVPPLLANLGFSLVERALLDAVCRQRERPFAELMHANAFGVELGAIREALGAVAVADVLRRPSLDRIKVRHTIGLGDPLLPGDIHVDEQLNDGLPHALSDCVRDYGCRYFKIKVSGDRERDGERLARIEAVLRESLGEDYHCTIDGNENFRAIEPLIEWWERLEEHPGVGRLWKRVLFVEQPLHRDVALHRDVGRALRSWNLRPPLVIDESDGSLEALPEALALGYAGTSHKNCKGVLKGLANAALLRQRRCEFPERPWILSGEDLANVGPVALLQDLCVVAALGIDHVERNGHHYFRGLSAFPRELQEAMVERHPDLYAWQGTQGFAALRMEEGELRLGSVNALGFGGVPRLSMAPYTALDDWSPSSLEVRGAAEGQ